MIVEPSELAATLNQLRYPAEGSELHPISGAGGSGGCACADGAAKENVIKNESIVARNVRFFFNEMLMKVLLP